MQIFQHTVSGKSMTVKKQLTQDRLNLCIILGLIFVLVILFSMNQKVRGLAQEIDSLSQAHAAIMELDTRHAHLDKRVAALQTLPEETKAMVIKNQVQAMAHSTAYMEQQGNGQHLEEFRIIQGLLEKINTEMHN